MTLTDSRWSLFSRSPLAPLGRGKQERPILRRGLWWGAWWAAALLLAAGLVFCHGCHEDEDNELSVPGWKVQREPDKKSGWEEKAPAASSHPVGR